MTLFWSEKINTFSTDSVSILEQYLYYWPVTNTVKSRVQIESVSSHIAVHMFFGLESAIHLLARKRTVQRRDIHFSDNSLRYGTTSCSQIRCQFLELEKYLSCSFTRLESSCLDYSVDEQQWKFSNAFVPVTINSRNARTLVLHIY